MQWELQYGAESVLGLLLPAAAAAAKSHQSCPTLCDPIDSSPTGSPVPGILQARILEWVPTSFSNAWKWKVKVKSLSRVRLLATPWTAAYQGPLSMGFSRQEYWSGLPLPSLLLIPSHIQMQEGLPLFKGISSFLSFLLSFPNSFCPPFFLSFLPSVFLQKIVCVTKSNSSYLEYIVIFEVSRNIK